MTQPFPAPTSLLDEIALKAATTDTDIEDAGGRVVFFDEEFHRVRLAEDYHRREAFPMAVIPTWHETIKAGSMFWVQTLGPSTVRCADTDR